mgnify:CR=1 FL=1
MMTLFVISSSAVAEGKSTGGDDFRKTAGRYESQAKKASANGNADHARIFKRLAAIKRHAAKLADEGKWSEIDWTEYHKLNKELYKGKGKNNKK